LEKGIPLGTRYIYFEECMRLKTQLAIKADIEGQAPAAWSRKNFEVLLKQNRKQWGCSAIPDNI
jgi:hypothetical protein